jgi:hypothetical protein
VSDERRNSFRKHAERWKYPLRSEPYTIIPLLDGEVSGSGTLVTIDGVRGILRQWSLLQILGLNVRKEGIALMAADDLGGDDLDTILDQYGPKSSTLGLLTEYLAGEKDSSLNLNNLKKQLNCLAVFREDFMMKSAQSGRWLFRGRRQFGYLIFRRFARLLCACYAIRSLHFSPGWHWRFQIHYLLLEE